MATMLIIRQVAAVLSVGLAVRARRRDRVVRTVTGRAARATDRTAIAETTEGGGRLLVEVRRGAVVWRVGVEGTMRIVTGQRQASIALKVMTLVEAVVVTEARGHGGRELRLAGEGERMMHRRESRNVVRRDERGRREPAAEARAAHGGHGAGVVRGAEGR